MPVNRAESHPGDLTCTACGKPEAFAFDGEDLCADCCHERGSCCAEPIDGEGMCSIAQKGDH